MRYGSQIQIRSLYCPLMWLTNPNYEQVQIEVIACGICAFDTHLFKSSEVPQKGPIQFGHESIGLVRKVGAGVKDVSIGDYVYCTEDAAQMSQVANIRRRRLCVIKKRVEDYRNWIAEPVWCVWSMVWQTPVLTQASMLL
jgi:threonine dehydrogenase-like Zn-dependent dehydrogenase